MSLTSSYHPSGTFSSISHGPLHHNQQHSLHLSNQFSSQNNPYLSQGAAQHTTRLEVGADVHASTRALAGSIKTDSQSVGSYRMASGDEISLRSLPVNPSTNNIIQRSLSPISNVSTGEELNTVSVRRSIRKRPNLDKQVNFKF